MGLDKKKEKRERKGNEMCLSTVVVICYEQRDGVYESTLYYTV